MSPKVLALTITPLWVAEVAGRTAYDSFALSEHPAIVAFGETGYYEGDSDIPSSNLLTSLAWVHHHHSVIELVDITFSITGTSRGVLQEHARHRMQSLTVQSTRYTMSGVLNAYVASSQAYGSVSKPTALGLFDKLVKDLDTLIFEDGKMHELETRSMYEKIELQLATGEVFLDDMLSKDGMAKLDTWKMEFSHGLAGREDLFASLQEAKKKRNVGDIFKHIVTDNWKVDMIVKFNLRSLKNYLDLRASGAAYWQIDMLAKEMIKAIPDKYLDLIVKKKKG